jgi:peroxiredoxin
MEEVPLLRALETKYKNQATIVGVSIDESIERADTTIRDRKMTWPVLADGKGFEGPIPAAYHIQGTPEVFVLDRDGRIFKRLGSAKQIDATLQEALR